MRIRSAGRISLLPAIGLGLTLALTACGGSAESTSGSDTEASAPAAVESSDPASEAAAPAGDEKEVKIGQTLKDPDMGDTIEVISAVRDFPSKESADVIADGGEVTGWIAFEADEKADTYLIEYTRAGAKVIGSDKEIAEFKKQIEIPAS